jgi:hypothetical protein
MTDWDDDLDTVMWRSRVGGTGTVEDRCAALWAVQDIRAKPREHTWILPWAARGDATTLGEHAARYICGASLVWAAAEGPGLKWLSTETNLEYCLERQGPRWAIRTQNLPS